MKQNFDTLFVQHERRIHYHIHRLNIRSEQYDDFFAEGIVALWQGLEDYDESKGSIGIFLNHRIRFRLIDLQRQVIRDVEKDTLAREAQMIEKDSGNTDRATNQMLVDTRGIKLKDETFWNDIREQLTDNQWKWVKHYVIHELSIKEIMALENVTEGAVKSWARQTRRKLKTKAFKHKFIEVIGA